MDHWELKFREAQAEIQQMSEFMEGQHTRIEKLTSQLHVIDALAHDRSTGPEVPDTLWRIRELAQEVF